jgi:glycosyltransferase involved in cell wall biosynthesis
VISVLIPVYNGEPFVIEQLESIRTQTMAVDEVVISDDGSTDDTPAVIEDYLHRHALDRWILLRPSANLGPAGNSLSLLRHAKGDFVFMADQDDVWEPHKVSTMVRHLETHSGAVAATSTERLVDQDGREILDPTILGRFGRNVTPFEGWLRLSAGDFIGHSSIPWHAMCVRRSVVDAVVASQPPDTSRTLGADWYVGLVGRLLGEFHMLGEPMMRRRLHASNASLGRLRRSTLLGTHRERRIELLDEVRHAHEQVLANPELQTHLTDQVRRALEQVIDTQRVRAAFTRRPGPLAAARVVSRIGDYRSMFGGWRAGLRVLGADVLYASRLQERRPRG